MRRGRLWLPLAVIAGVLIWSGGEGAYAQSTGSSMGGGSWSSGGSSYSGGGSWSSGGSSSWSSGGSSGGFFSSSDSSYSGGGSGGGDCDGGAIALFIILAFVILFKVGAWMIAQNQQRLSASSYDYSFTAGPKVDVSGLRLAIDWNQRAWVQKELERISTATDLSSNAGLLSMLREVALTLRRVKDSWLYAGVVDAEPMSQSQAQAFFQKQAADARERYKDELSRNIDGTVTTKEAPDHLVARHDEGEGLVVITILIAARGVLTDFATMPITAENVRAWLETLNHITSGRLVACEVIWSPAAEEDRMSSAELEVLYPKMKKIRHGVLSGRVKCEYCSGAFPAELVTCPHCGGRVSEEQKEQAAA